MVGAPGKAPIIEPPGLSGNGWRLDITTALT